MKQEKKSPGLVKWPQFINSLAQLSLNISVSSIWNFVFFSSDKHNKNDLFSRFWWYFISNLSGSYVFLLFSVWFRFSIIKLIRTNPIHVCGLSVFMFYFGFIEWPNKVLVLNQSIFLNINLLVLNFNSLENLTHLRHAKHNRVFVVVVGHSECGVKIF